MSVVMNCSQYNVCYKGKFSQTENGTPYYKSNSATKAGAVLAVPAFLFNAVPAIVTSNKFIEAQKNMYKNFGLKDEQIGNILKETKKNGKYAIPIAALAAGLTLGCGMIVDHIRNSRARKTADFARQVGTKRALTTGDSVALSRKNHPYYESNVGSKYGAILGAGCGLIASFMTPEPKKILAAPKMAAFGIVSNIVIFGLGGLIMGKIADNNTNKNAEKNA